MNLKRRNLIWLVPLILIVTFPLWRLPIGNFLTPRGGYDPAYGNIDTDVQNFTLETVTILQAKGGRVTAKIKAASAFTSDVPNEYTLVTVNADLFSESGTITNVLARRGIFNGEQKLLTLEEDVVIHKPEDNQSLYTELLYYDDEKRTIHCPQPVRLVGSNIEIKGSSLDYDIEQGRYDITGRVYCVIEERLNP